MSNNHATAESYASTVTGYYNITDAGYSGTTAVSTDPLFVVGNGADENNLSNALTILKNGNVGIGDHQPVTTRLLVKGSGTTDATTGLDVQDGNGASLVHVRDDGAVGVGADAATDLRLLVKGSGTTNATSALDVQDGNGASLVHVRDDGAVGIGADAATDLRLLVKGIGTTDATAALDVQDGSGASLLYVGDDGFVGIGTAPCLNETFKFKVDGYVKAKEIVVEVASIGWCDYVFEDDYELMPLDRLEAEIQEIGHLPGIPSSAEVEEKGVNLSEMQAKLLLKVEELTLYTIEQEKRLKNQEQRLESLEMENRELRQLMEKE